MAAMRVVLYSELAESSGQSNTSSLKKDALMKNKRHANAYVEDCSRNKGKFIPFSFAFESQMQLGQRRRLLQ